MYDLNKLKTMDKLITFRSHLLNLKKHEELARQAELGTEVLETIADANKKVVENLVGQATADLADKNGISSQEDIERIRFTLNSLHEWVNQGMEIYAAITAPKEVQAVFPPLEAQALPTTLTRKLEECTGKSEQEQSE